MVTQWMLKWCLAGTVLIAGGVYAAEDGSTQPPEKPKSPSLQQIEDVPGRPRVLLIGDSISMGYTLAVRDRVGDKANVHRPPTNCGSTLSGLAHLDDWLGDKPWDVIHFNFGLHDLKYLKEDQQNVPPDKYENNLRRLVARMQQTGATIIFASTTPVPSRTKPSQYPRKPEDVPAYNEIAARIMSEQGIAVNDLYNLVLPRLDELQVPEDVHFRKAGSLVMAEQISAMIGDALAARAEQTDE